MAEAGDNNEGNETQQSLFSLPLEPFIIFDPSSKEIKVIPVLRFDALIAPRYNALQYMFLTLKNPPIFIEESSTDDPFSTKDDGSTDFPSFSVFEGFTDIPTSNVHDDDHVVAVFVQATCDPPILYESNLVNFITGYEKLQVNLVESFKILDGRVENSLSKYPIWFPNKGDNSYWRYDQDFCNAICCSLHENRSKTVESLNLLLDINFLQPWKFMGAPKSSAHNDTYPDIANVSACRDICPLSRVKFSLNMNANMHDMRKRGFGPMNASLSATMVFAASSKLTVKEIRYQKSFYEFMSEIGGHMGLFIGASVITLIELLEYFGFLLSSVLCAYKLRSIEDGTNRLAYD